MASKQRQLLLHPRFRRFETPKLDVAHADGDEARAALRERNISHLSIKTSDVTRSLRQDRQQ